MREYIKSIIIKFTDGETIKIPHANQYGFQSTGNTLYGWVSITGEHPRLEHFNWSKVKYIGYHYDLKQEGNK